jgi:RNA polymerase sigma-70 factor (sigma-E family)
MRFEEFAAARLPAVLRFAGVLTGDRGLAEDVVQEVLIRTHNRWQQIGELERPELYVRKMVVNEYLSWRRRSWRLIPFGAAHDIDRRLVADHAQAHAERDVLLAELGELPRRQRTVLVLRYYEGLPDNEIADVIGCTPGTVRGYASRALEQRRHAPSGQSGQLHDTSPGSGPLREGQDHRRRIRHWHLVRAALQVAVRR